MGFVGAQLKLAQLDAVVLLLLSLHGHAHVLPAIRGGKAGNMNYSNARMQYSQMMQGLGYFMIARRQNDNRCCGNVADSFSLKEVTCAATSLTLLVWFESYITAF